MPKRAIVTLAIGPVWRDLPIIHRAMKRYARRCGADFVKITTRRMDDYPHVFYEKYQIYDLFHLYSEILYLDSDVLVTPVAFDSVDIFEVHKGNRHICLLNERAHTDWQTRAHVREHWGAIGRGIPSTWNGANYNAGVMLIPKPASYAVRPSPKGWCTKSWTADQITLNARIAHLRWPVTDLERCWNEMPFSSDAHNLRDARFVHYGGWGAYSDDIEFMLGMAKAWPYLPLADRVKPGHKDKVLWSVPAGRAAR